MPAYTLENNGVFTARLHVEVEGGPEEPPSGSRGPWPRPGGKSPRSRPEHTVQSVLAGATQTVAVSPEATRVICRLQVNNGLGWVTQETVEDCPPRTRAWRLSGTTREVRVEARDTGS